MLEEKPKKDLKQVEAEALAKVKEFKKKLAQNTQDFQNSNERLREKSIALQIRQEKLNQEIKRANIELDPQKIKDNIKYAYQSIRDLQSRGVNNKAINKLQESIREQEELLRKRPKLLQNLLASQEELNNSVKKTDKDKNALLAKWEELNKGKKELLQAQKALTIATRKRKYTQVISGAKKALLSLTNLTRRKSIFLEQMSPEDIEKFTKLRDLLHKNKSQLGQKTSKKEQIPQPKKPSISR